MEKYSFVKWGATGIVIYTEGCGFTPGRFPHVTLGPYKAIVL